MNENLNDQLVIRLEGEVFLHLSHWCWAVWQPLTWMLILGSVMRPSCSAAEQHVWWKGGLDHQSIFIFRFCTFWIHSGQQNFHWNMMLAESDEQSQFLCCLSPSCSHSCQCCCFSLDILQKLPRMLTPCMHYLRWLYSSLKRQAALKCPNICCRGVSSWT